ncbi:YIP1 family protein [Zooshikella marina]|uniref:Yip1 family protein n=1 Tax=Zooshikella ganghwensis TaxID=202772 RepID=UPI0004124C23|nr:Yip1 family protein [Zooshikella ganghwensis]MBU2707348.1 YIP1 family protein [Zooshikella ganghwensis]
MVLNHVWGLFTHPREEWVDIRKETLVNKHRYLSHVLILAAVPAISSYVGATWTGWSIGELDSAKLTAGSALLMSLMSYLAIIVAVFIMGAFIHWMAKTYGTDPSLIKCIIFTAYVGTPLYLVGIVGIYPSIPITMTAIIIAIGYTAYLLYIGIPRVMEIPPERGFLFSTSVVCVGLVLLVSMKVVTAIFWGIGIGPVYSF